MNTAKESFLKNLLNPDQFTLVNLFAIFGVIIAVVPLFLNLPLMTAIAISVGILFGIILLIGVAWLWNQWRKEKVLEKSLPTYYEKAVIRFSTQYYLRPFCSVEDPSDPDAKELEKYSKTKVFKTFDRYLSDNTTDRFITLLGGSGTGKTSFVLNYFARNQRRIRWRRKPMKVIPLGTPEIEAQIAAIENKESTVLFLDGFDEIVDAFKKPADRMNELWKQCEKFKKVIITCRTQFFTEDQKIPRETNIRYHGAKPAGMPANYRNSILYLLPFENWQVRRYIWRRFHYWNLVKIRKAFKIKDTIPTLSIRPMLLAYIPDLIEDKDVKNREYRNSFEIYEKMVDAWMKREVGILENTSLVNLQEFSERLAVDLYIKSKQGDAAHIHHEELEPLAQTWEIDLNKFQISSRSLLNRDAVGNFKFAHRSILEFLFVKRFISGDPQTQNVLPWSDQMQKFIWEVIESYINKRIRLPFSWAGADLSGLGSMNIKPVYSLRKNNITLKENTVQSRLVYLDFFDSRKHKEGKGSVHVYQLQKDGKVVMDYATGLMWQQSGSSKSMKWKDCQEYIDQLNREKYAGYNDWRLPTLEEAMSLMERKKNGKLYIDPVFDAKQHRIWTADLESASRAWYVSFFYGYCDSLHVVSGYYARAVRS